MNDQAAILKELASQQPITRPKFHCPFWVITGGKGGVGKTTVAANLAVTLAQYKKRVLVVDLDMGLANLDVFFRLHPRKNLGAVLTGESAVADCILEGPSGIHVLPAPNGQEEFASLNPERRAKLIHEIAKFSKNYDIVLADTAAGIAPDVLGFASAADRIVLVTTPEPAALTDAYAILKLMVLKRRDSKIHLLMNAAAHTEEASQAINKIRLIAQHFLNYPVEFLGSIPRDASVPRANREQKPIAVCAPDSLAAGALRHVAQKLFKQSS